MIFKYFLTYASRDKFSFCTYFSHCVEKEMLCLSWPLTSAISILLLLLQYLHYNRQQSELGRGEVSSSMTIYWLFPMTRTKALRSSFLLLCCAEFRTRVPLLVRFRIAWFPVLCKNLPKSSKFRYFVGDFHKVYNFFGKNGAFISKFT